MAKSDKQVQPAPAVEAVNLELKEDKGIDLSTILESVPSSMLPAMQLLMAKIEELEKKINKESNL